jgi:ribosome biogenesis GTPase
MASLTSLGWDQFFENAFESYRREGYLVGRVALQQRGSYRLYCETGEVAARVAGRIHFAAAGSGELPAVGDWVVISKPDRESKTTIHAVLPRKSKFSRKAAGAFVDEQVVATNIDTVFLVQGLDRDFNLRRLERYLVAAVESNADPVVVLSKADLCDDVAAREAEASSVAMGFPVHAISSLTGAGLDQLDKFVRPGVTIAFLGSSGAGKSTLINRLIGEEIQKVQEVRRRDGRGRHTTTHRELIIMPRGGLLIDTPGMRELQLWEAGSSLGETFSDVEEIAARCRFTDCRHGTEPGCAVREAIESGRLDPQRLESYGKLEKELEYLDSRMDQQVNLARKDRTKKIHRAMRRIKPHRS